MHQISCIKFSVLDTQGGFSFYLVLSCHVYWLSSLIDPYVVSLENTNL